MLVHVGQFLWLWRNYPQSVNVPIKSEIKLPEPTSEVETNGITIKTFDIILEFPCNAVISLHRKTGEDITLNISKYTASSKTLKIVSSELSAGEVLNLSYYEYVLPNSDALYLFMNYRKSQHFVFNNRLYILDGKNYLVYDGSSISQVKNSAYVPTTYIGIIPAGENADIGTEYEQRNILTPKFKHTFIADGTTKEFL